MRCCSELHNLELLLATGEYDLSCHTSTHSVMSFDSLKQLLVIDQSLLPSAILILQEHADDLSTIQRMPISNFFLQSPHPEFRYQLRDDDPALFTHVVPRNSVSGIVGSVPHTVPEAPLKRYDVPRPYQSYRPV